MRKGLALGIMVLVVATGCASGFPEMPKVETQEGRDCMRTCQREHNVCTNSCSGTDMESPSRKACIDDCVDALERCYRHCGDKDRER